MFNKLEEDFSQVKYTVNAFNPENLDKRFEDVNTQTIKLDSTLERVGNRLDRTEKQLQKYDELMSSIKSYENVLDALEHAKKTVEIVRKLKTEVQKQASRMDVMFQNLEESVGTIGKANQLAEGNKAAVKDILADLSRIETRLEGLAKKEDFELLKSDVTVMKKALFEAEFKGKGKKEK